MREEISYPLMYNTILSKYVYLKQKNNNNLEFFIKLGLECN